MAKVSDEDCFSHCSWLEAKIRCYHCPYIELVGPILAGGGMFRILNPKVKGRWNIWEQCQQQLTLNGQPLRDEFEI